MFALLGTLGIVTGVVGSAWLTVEAVRAARGPEAQPGRLIRPVGTLLAGAVLAMLALEAALVFNDFSVEYVANHHARVTPFPFNVATAWAALEGSIVLWGLVLAIFTWFTWRGYRRSPDRLGAGALAVLGIVAVFFFGLQLSVANPFRVCVEAAANGCIESSLLPWAAAQAPPDGPGPNPLLQNHILMAIHPPMLYLGYVGLTVPFAFAISALALGLPGVEWLRRSRRSTLVAWTFLTLGITLGGWWAYEVLSWGGYWAWDPVENASFMPWLVATAFLHSALVQMRRGALQAWNFVLVNTAFALTILGTFLTRSGTVASVHSFTQSAIGPVLLGFLFVVLAGSFGLFATRSHLVAESPRLDSLFSREGSFLLNNLLLTIYAFIVVTGTLYPIVVEALSGDRVSVGEPFFNRLAVPLSFGLLLAMGVGPLVPWRDADPGVLAARLRLPLQIGLLAGAVTVITTSRIGYVVAAVVLGVFVIASAVSLLIERAGHAARARGGRLGTEIRRQLKSDTGFWAGQLSHSGVALVAIGMALAANLALHGEVSMAPGDTTRFAGYELTYRSPFLITEPHRRVQGATIDVYHERNLVTTLQPRANFFGTDTSGITTPAVHSGIGGDLYLTLIDIDPTGILLRLNTSPGIWLLWTGGLVTTAGGIWSLTARKRRPVEVAVGV
jgi:cytochrome c-type biogenesis protein CcmF